MLMGRRIENWYVWLAVNTLAVPLYMTRGLNLTAGLYFLFWINARMVCISGARSCGYHEAFRNGTGGWQIRAFALWS